MRKIEIDATPILDGTVIDVESTHWKPEKGELLTTGFLSNKGIVILQRLESSEDDFRKSVVEEIETKKRPWYVFNKKVEEGFLQITIDEDLQLENEAAFWALQKEGLLNHYNSLCDPLFNDEIPRLWDAWKKTRDVVFLSKVVRHNYCCLGKEYYLKLRRIDKLEVTRIVPFRSSAQIEKNYIRHQLGFSPQH